MEQQEVLDLGGITEPRGKISHTYTQVILTQVPPLNPSLPTPTDPRVHNLCHSQPPSPTLAEARSGDGGGGGGGTCMINQTRVWGTAGSDQEGQMIRSQALHRVGPEGRVQFGGRAQLRDFNQLLSRGKVQNAAAWSTRWGLGSWKGLLTPQSSFWIWGSWLSHHQRRHQATLSPQTQERWASSRRNTQAPWGY